MNIQIQAKDSGNIAFEGLYTLAGSKKLPHGIIIECEDANASYGAAINIAKIALCCGEEKPCGECGDCIKLDINAHPDVKTVYASGANKSVKIEDIRFIRQDAYVISNEGGYKFYIIQDADFMTAQAQNALIKILEEPPKGVTFMLLCKSVTGLLATVRSRSQIFKMSCSDGQNGFSLALELGQKIAAAYLSSNKCEVLRLTASVPCDRKFFKELVQSIIENLLKMYYDSKDHKISQESFIETLEDLKRVANLTNKNINYNLLACYLCACL